MPVLPLFSSVQTECYFAQSPWYNLELGYRQIFLLSIKDVVVCKEKVNPAITWKAAAYRVWLRRESDYPEELQTKGPSGLLSLNPC